MKGGTYVNDAFPRIITLLRKERGLSQKKAAEELQVSQALLSHYEKGIRECGLEFVVKIANFYNVSCDYLLGRSPNRSGATITIDDLPEDTESKGRRKTVIIATLNKKLIMNSIHVIYGILQECNNHALTEEVSSFLSTSIYKIFRLLYSANPKNPQGLFAAPYKRHFGLANASMELSEANAACLISGEAVEDLEPLEKEKAPHLSPESITKKYPSFAASLFNLIQNVEQKMGIKKKQDH